MDEPETSKSSGQNGFAETSSITPMDSVIASSSGDHHWYTVNHHRPTFCNFCRGKLSGVPWHGLGCEVCKVKAHKHCAERIREPCKWTVDASIPPQLQYVNPENTLMPHQFVEGNLPMSSKCVVCEKVCGSVLKLQDWRCLWCSCCVHDACLSQLARGCSLGNWALSVLPPLAIRTVEKEGQVSLRADAYGGDCGGGSPLLVLVNSKSGDNQGQRMIRKFRRLLNPVQVFDICLSGPAPALTFFNSFDSFRVLVCGGDGTVGWVLSTCDRLNMLGKCHMAILPLGTGNDLARVLGWGHAFYDDNQLPQLVRTFERAHTTMLDRWSVYAMDEVLYDAVRNFEKRLAERVEDVLSAEQPKKVIESSKKLCITAKELIEKVAATYGQVEEWEAQAGTPTDDPISQTCSTFLAKLDSLMKELPESPTLDESGFEQDNDDESQRDSDDERMRRESLVGRANSLKKALREMMEVAERGIDNYSDAKASTKRERFRKKRSKTTPSALKHEHEHLTMKLESMSIGIQPPTPAANSREQSTLWPEDYKDAKHLVDRPEPEEDDGNIERPDRLFKPSSEGHLYTQAGSEIKMSHSDSSIYEHSTDVPSTSTAILTPRTPGTVAWNNRIKGKKRSVAEAPAQRNGFPLGMRGSSLIAELLLLNAKVLGFANAGHGVGTRDQFKELKVMNNYFGIGLDAKIALDFHNKREEGGPDKTRSRSKLLFWYGMLGGKELMHRTYKNLEQRIRLECDGKLLELPNLQGIVILNIPSYSGGANFWGNARDDTFKVQSYDDKLLEVVALFGVIHVATSRVPNMVRLQNHRLAQCRSVKITIIGDEPLPVQVDGEPWSQPPGVLMIQHKNRAQLFGPNPAFEACLKKWDTKREKSTAPSTPTALAVEEAPFTRRAAELVQLVESELACLGVSQAFLSALENASTAVQRLDEASYRNAMRLTNCHILGCRKRTGDAASFAN
ncbi:unnamed protein product, partial [Mesorhabditis spiculigera]